MSDTDETKEALGRLAAARARYTETEAAHEAARAELISAVVDALKASAGPTVVSRTSEFTEAYVRKIARENDIGPAKPGIKKGTKPRATPKARSTQE